MKFSLNSLLNLNLHESLTGDIAAAGVDTLIEKIGAQLGAVEDVIHLGDAYRGIIIVQIMNCYKHPDADRLNICKINDNGVMDGVDRDKDGLIQVVCGAPNVREGLLVAWLPPGVVVPETFQSDPFVLSVREIRGQVSNGMLASPRELAISDSHDGILEIQGDYKPGSDFATSFGLINDVVFDVENKMFTHRPDCFGMIGIDRELAGIQSMPFKSPAWYQTAPYIPDIEGEELGIEFSNELPELVPRFTAIALRGVTVRPSPVWLQIELAKIGIRSINNIVDYSNYFMMLTAQPIHIYDYDKVRSIDNSDTAGLVVRNPKPGEKIKLLNGKEIEPRAEAMMVATRTKTICVGGAMGGIETEVDASTQNIIIEAATWDMYEIRRTSMANGIFTDAVARFNKGQSPLQNLAVLAKVVEQICKDTGAKVASKLIDDIHLEKSVIDRSSLHQDIEVSADFINDRLGSSLSAEAMKALLENTEFKVIETDGVLTVTAPFWRTDIELREDLVEEVGRLYGYDKLPLVLPKRNIGPAQVNQLLSIKAAIRNSLVRAGTNEVLTYSFVHGALLDKSGQDKSLAFKIGNALSPDLQYYRLSIVPSLLDKVKPNIKAGYNEFAIFELGKVHETTAMDNDGLPLETDNLALVYASKTKKDGAAYYYARHIVDFLLYELKVPYSLKPLTEVNQQFLMPFEPIRSAVIFDPETKQNIGVVGELRSEVRQRLKLPEYCAAFELSTNLLLQFQQKKYGYTPLSKYPKVEQDICLKLKNDISYEELFNFLKSKLEEHKPMHSYFSLAPLDIYQRATDMSNKQVTFRLAITSYEKTMTDTEINSLLDQLAEFATQQFGAERI